MLYNFTVVLTHSITSDSKQAVNRERKRGAGVKIFLIVAVIVIGAAVAVVGLGAINSDPEVAEESPDQTHRILEPFQKSQKEIAKALENSPPAVAPGSANTSENGESPTATTENPTAPATTGVDESPTPLTSFDRIAEYSTPTISVGPIPVAAGSTNPDAVSLNQKRIFRAPDGTVALFQDRPVGPDGKQVEIVMRHSHDDGQTWHGEHSVGTEVSSTSYSGHMDDAGNLYLAYGRYAEKEAGGAIHFRKFTYNADTHDWKAGTAHRALWDWPGKGASKPVVQFTGKRVWIAYNYYDGSAYQAVTQYADPDEFGDYPQENWSVQFPLTLRVESPEMDIALVAYGGKLGAIYSRGTTEIMWRTLADPLLEDHLELTNAWSEPEDVYQPQGENQNLEFSATSDDSGNVHVAFNVNQTYVAFKVYNGRSWNNPRIVATNDVQGASIATDGTNVWILWERRSSSGLSHIEAKRWVKDAGGWDVGSIQPWTNEFGRPTPSLIIHNKDRDAYTFFDSRIIRSSGGNAMLPFDSKEDKLYLGNKVKFDQLPISFGRLLSANSNSNNTELRVPQVYTWEYWDGSEWKPLAHDTSDSSLVSSFEFLDGAEPFKPPGNWKESELNGETGYFLRVDLSDVSSKVAEQQSFNFPRNFVGPLSSNVSKDGIVDWLWADREVGSEESRVWFGSVSLSSASPTPVVPEHTHLQQQDESPFFAAVEHPKSLPDGSPRQYVSVELDDELFEYQLLDGDIRFIRVIETNIEFEIDDDPDETKVDWKTVWGTATVEVSGLGIPPERAVIPAAYFQSPTVLNDVRIFVEITKDFSHPRLVGAVGTDKSARLMVSDARYSLTDLTSYHWPFPGMLWGQGHSIRHYQSLRVNEGKHFHDASFTQTVPANTAFNTWYSGTLSASWLRTGWAVSLAETVDEYSPKWHTVSILDDVNFDNVSNIVEAGSPVGTVKGDIRWGSDLQYDWAPLLAEWYIAGSTPLERSYVKDWLVAGTFRSSDNEPLPDLEGQTGSLNPPSEEQTESINPLAEEFLSEEALLQPKEGDISDDIIEWQRYDGIVPGVVNVADAASGFRNSGWASANGNGAFSGAYLATYVWSPIPRNVTLNIGSSDGVKAWLNEDVVLERNAMVRVREPEDWTIVPDFYKVKARLNEGWNRVLFKVVQGQADFGGLQAAQNAWQLTFRVSDSAGNPIPYLVTSPEKNRRDDPLKLFAFAETDETRLARLAPPSSVHGWPEKADLAVGESQVYVLVDGTQREVKLLDFNILYDQLPGLPRQWVRVDVDVQVTNLEDNTVETAKLNAAMGGVPIVVNGLRIMAYSADFTKKIEQAGDTGDFPLDEGKDVGLAINDAQYPMYPGLDQFRWPYEVAFQETRTFNTWLHFQNLRGGQAHGGFDFALPCGSRLIAPLDALVNYKWYADQGAVFLNPKEQNTTPGWYFSHGIQEGNLTPLNSRVEQGTPLIRPFPGCGQGYGGGGFHAGSRGSHDYNPQQFWIEVWQNQHKDDFPSPRYWLTLSAYNGDLEENHLSQNETGDLPATLRPREGDFDKNGNKQWKFFDNLGNAVTRIWESASPYPWGHFAHKPENVMGYSAIYLYSTEDHTDDEDIHLKWGMSYGGKLWLNGETILDEVEERYLTHDTSAESPLVVDKYDIPLKLKKGWNTLITKTNHGERNLTSWTYSAKIGDENGMKIADEQLSFSVRDINLRVPNTDETSIEIEWDELDKFTVHASTYKLDVATDAGFENLVIDGLDMGLVSNHLISDLEPGVNYFIRVKPYSYTDLGGTVYWSHIDVINTIPGQFPSEEEPETVAPISDAAGDEWLSTKGNRIVDESGDTVILRGVNIENREWQWAEPTEESEPLSTDVPEYKWAWNQAPTIAYELNAIPVAAGDPSDGGWGANVITLAIASGPVNRNDPVYLSHLDELIALAKANGAYTILVYRYAEPNDSQPIMPDLAAQDAMASLAGRYSDNPSVLYALQVEPHNLSWRDLKPRFTDMIDAIRLENSKSLIIVPGTEWSRIIDHVLTDAIDRPNLVYKTHPYDKWAVIEANYNLDEVSDIYPVLIGEFGALTQMSTDDVNRLLEFAEDKGISWVGWLFSAQGCPCMLSDMLTFETTLYGEVIKQKLQEHANDGIDDTAVGTTSGKIGFTFNP